MSKHLYSKTIKSAKRESWRNFITSHGNKEPWGFVSKHSANKLKIERVISTLRRDGNFTLNIQETANYLLDTHVPEDEIEDDTPGQREIRKGARRLHEAPDAPKITDEEVKSLARSMKNGKAPRPDLIEVEVLKTACTQITDQIPRLFDRCLEFGVFPKAWKEGSLRVLLKGEDKDVTDPKSYRPLCLLSVLGKLFEKHLNERLLKTSMAPGMISDRQYGFLPGRSAEDATVELCRMVSQSEHRLITGIFCDISGAFENVCGPKVLDNLRKRDCPDNVFKVLTDYFEDRSVKITLGDIEVSKRPTRGCPQGWVLGPACWNIMFGELLRILEAEVPDNLTAYADDLMVLVEANSRRELETKAQCVVNKIVEWCKSAKLRISEKKTVAIMLRNKTIKRAPIGRRGGP